MTRPPYFTATLLLIALIVISGPKGIAQTDLGTWETPFNHVVPLNWEPGQPGWDGDPATFPGGPSFMAGHMAVIPVGPHRGKVLIWNWMRVPSNPSIIDTQYWSIVDPENQVFLNYELVFPPGDGDIFCSGHAWTKDGHLLVAGGDRYVPDATQPSGYALKAPKICLRFDPLAPTGNAMWVREPDMQIERWYPTITTMGTDCNGDDLLLVTGGARDGAFLGPKTYEVFDPTLPPGSGTWQPNPNNPAGPYFDGPPVTCPQDNLGVYPRHSVLSSGKLFTAGWSMLGYRVDHSNIGLGIPPVWEVQTPAVVPSRSYACEVLFPNVGGPSGGLQDIVVRLGGTAQFWNPFTCTTVGAPFDTNTVEYCYADLPSTDPNWTWFSGPSMTYPRTLADAALLPDATIVVIGGEVNDYVAGTGAPVFETELFNDVPFAWRTLAPLNVNRRYHSTTVLLPSGKVLTGGAEIRSADYSLFQPHYLTNGTVRPVILNAPQTLTMGYGQTKSLEFQSLPAGVSIKKVVLIAPGSITHHSDMHQRYVELDIVGFQFDKIQQVGGPPPSPGNPKVRFQSPPSSNHAPKGYYMLFLVTNPQSPANRGTPSVATWVKLQ